MSASRKRSLLNREKPKEAPEHEVLEALEASEESDLDEFDMFGAEDEDLEVVEPTLRSGTFDEWGPSMDSAVMDEYTDDLPAAGLWLGDQQRRGLRTADDVFRSLDPEEYAVTEPGLPAHELLPPPSQQDMERVKGIKRTPTPPPAVKRNRVSLEAVAQERSQEADRYMSRVATEEDLRLAAATPWLAALGMSIGMGVGGLALVLALAVFLATRPSPEPVPPTIPEDPPVEAPVDVAPIEEPVDEEPGEDEAEEEVEPVAAPAPRPRPRAAPVEPEPEPEPVAIPDPEPVPEPAGPAPEPEPKKKRGLFGKKKDP